jgi:hypothetical protein
MSNKYAEKLKRFEDNALLRSAVIKDAKQADHKWSFVMHQGQPGTDLGFELLEILSTTIGLTFGAVSSIRTLRDFTLDGEQAGRALSTIPAAILKKGGVDFVKRILVGARRDGKELIFDGPAGENQCSYNLVFSANYGELLRVLTTCIKLNWGSFFDEWLGYGSSLSQTRSFQGMFEKLLTGLASLDPNRGSGDSGEQGDAQDSTSTPSSTNGQSMRS